MEPFHADVRRLAKRNDDYRRVVQTLPHSQLVLMALRDHEEIGEEIHAVDQLFYVVAGAGEAIVDGHARPLRVHDLVGVPAGARHNVRHTGGRALRLISVYAPPQHPEGTVHHTRAEAAAAERSHHPERPAPPPT